MSTNPFSNYWISAVIFPAYFVLWIAFFLQKRKLILQERGLRSHAKITKIWTQAHQHGKTYCIKYLFVNDDIAYETKARYKHSEWSAFSVGQQIEILYDARNCKTYNLPYSKLGSQTYCAAFLGVLSLSYILGFGVGFGIVLFKFKWYHFLVTTFIIPFCGFLLIGSLLFCCCARCCNQYGETKQLRNYSLIHLEGGMDGSHCAVKTEQETGNFDMDETEMGKVNFSGIWVLKSSINLDEYYKSEGYNWLQRKIMSKMTMTQIIKQNGDSVAVEFLIGSNGMFGNWSWQTVIDSYHEFEYTDPDTSKGYVRVRGVTKWNADQTRIITEWYKSNDITKKYESVQELSAFGKIMIMTTRNSVGKELVHTYELDQTGMKTQR